MSVDFQGGFIRRLVSPGSRAEGSGLRIVPGFGRKHINNEESISGQKDGEEIKQYMDSLVIHFVQGGAVLGRPIVI